MLEVEMVSSNKDTIASLEAGEARALVQKERVMSSEWLQQSNCQLGGNSLRGGEDALEDGLRRRLPRFLMSNRL